MLRFCTFMVFGKSRRRQDPVHIPIYKKVLRQFVLASLHWVRINLGDSTMKTHHRPSIRVGRKGFGDYQKLGKEVIVVGTSFGGALTLYLASSIS